MSEDVNDIRMANADGFHVDVTYAPVPQTMMSIRLNVDNFDEAYELLLSKGFKNVQGDRITYTPSSKTAMLIAPQGYSINISEHIKK